MKWLLLTVSLGYVAYAVAMIALHPRFIYPFQPDSRVLSGFSRVALPGGISVQERKGAGPIILYFMGNVGSLSYFESAFQAHQAADRHVIALEYKGGSGLPGQPSEKVLKHDALVAADYALGFDKPLIVQGFSLGTGLATFVASNRSVAGVILTAPYDRLCGLMSSKAFLPACILPFVQKWHSIDAAREIDIPILITHGAEDKLIPPNHSRVFSKLPNVNRRLIEGAGHNDIGNYSDHRDAIEAFILGLEDQ